MFELFSSKKIVAPVPNPTETIHISRNIYEEVARTIGEHPAESGGFLGSSDGETIDHFYFDSTAKTSPSTYSPDTATVNSILKEWNEKGVKLVGNVHSHPDGCTYPSLADIEYAEKIKSALGIKKFLIIIIQPERS